MYSSMKGIHLGMTLFPLYKSALAFPALEKYYPLFFLALAPVTARPFEYSSSVPCGAQEREKSIMGRDYCYRQERQQRFS